jgi:hypothetical protein
MQPTRLRDAPVRQAGGVMRGTFAEHYRRWGFETETPAFLDELIAA